MKNLFYLILLFFLFSCKKEKDEVKDTGGKINISFEHYVGDSTLTLDNAEYINQNGDTFTVSLFNYYISNIALTADDGSVFTEANSYHLVSSYSDASKKIQLSNVPLKNYIKLTYLIGVDSTKNVSGAQGGDLDPAKGMFWNWNSGYIMAKFEGSCTKSPDIADGVYLHVGGFSGSNKVLRKVEFMLPSAAQVNVSKSPSINIKTNLLSCFDSPNLIDFSSLYVIHMPGADAKKIADNYAKMFSIKNVEN